MLTRESSKKLSFLVVQKKVSCYNIVVVNRKEVNTANVQNRQNLYKYAT